MSDLVFDGAAAMLPNRMHPRKRFAFGVVAWRNDETAPYVIKSLMAAHKRQLLDHAQGKYKSGCISMKVDLRQCSPIVPFLTELVKMPI